MKTYIYNCKLSLVMCLYQCMWVPPKTRSVRSFGARVAGDCESDVDAGSWSSGPLEEQYVLLTIEPSLQHLCPPTDKFVCVLNQFLVSSPSLEEKQASHRKPCPSVLSGHCLLMGLEEEIAQRVWFSFSIADPTWRKHACQTTVPTLPVLILASTL